MSEQTKTRRQRLEEFLLENPHDAFARYGIALECFREGDLATADMQFRALLENHPDYVPAYQMYAQMLVQTGRVEEAKDILCKGMESATRTGNAHARSEMEGQLSDLQ